MTTTNTYPTITATGLLRLCRDSSRADAAPTRVARDRKEEKGC